MRLSSKDIEHNELMNEKFTCDGSDISPHLKWKNAPEGTKSFAISCVDPDAPSGDWIHWIVINIPKDVTEIPRNGPVPGEEIENDFGKTEYGGPCPPSGQHRYYFRVYALKKEKVEKIDKSNFKNELKENALETDQIIGLYERS